MSESTCGFKSRQPHHYPFVPAICARVVELADSLDSGSSVLYGRAGSSPASRTKPHRKQFRWVPPTGSQLHTYARVVELVDSLDSGSSVHYAREGSSPSSRTSSSQASYRLRRFFYTSHQKLIVRSFCCSSLSAAIRCAGFATEERGRYRIVLLSHWYTSEQAAYCLLRLFQARARPFRCSSFPTMILFTEFAVGFGYRSKNVASRSPRFSNLAKSQEAPAAWQAPLGFLGGVCMNYRGRGR